MKPFRADDLERIDTTRHNRLSCGILGVASVFGSWIYGVIPPETIWTSLLKSGCGNGGKKPLVARR
jgi:hypothetical protein